MFFFRFLGIRVALSRSSSQSQALLRSKAYKAVESPTVTRTGRVASGHSCLFIGPKRSSCNLVRFFSIVLVRQNNRREAKPLLRAEFATKTSSLYSVLQSASFKTASSKSHTESSVLDDFNKNLTSEKFDRAGLRSLSVLILRVDLSSICAMNSFPSSSQSLPSLSQDMV